MYVKTNQTVVFKYYGRNIVLIYISCSFVQVAKQIFSFIGEVFQS
jgi:hypothetical protein